VVVEVVATIIHRPAAQEAQAAALVDRVVLLLLTEIPPQLVQAKEIMVVQVVLAAVAIRAQAVEVVQALLDQIDQVVQLAQVAQDQPG
jgi:hypothetical protein